MSSCWGSTPASLTFGCPLERSGTRGERWSWDLSPSDDRPAATCSRAFAGSPGSQGRLGDASFSHYLSTTLGMLTLEGPLLHDFRRLLVCLSRLFEGSDDNEQLARDIAALRTKLLDARFAERMWDEATAMVDERTARMNAASAGALQRLGLERLPEHVVVGLLQSRQDVSDPVDDVIRRDSYQRTCATLMRKRGGVASAASRPWGAAPGRCTKSRTPATRQAGRSGRARGNAGQAIRPSLAFGRLAIGAQGAALASLPDGAFGSREGALAGRPPRTCRLRLGIGYELFSRLRKELGQALAQSPSLLSPRFQRYIEAAQVHCGYRLEPTRAHLEAGFDQIADALVAHGAMNEKSMGDLRGSIVRDAAKATTVSELSTGYRRGISEVELALTRPVKARRDQAVRRAVDFIREHLSEPLNLDAVSRVAGFEAHHFSKLFVESEKVTFQSYVRNLRLERAEIDAALYDAQRRTRRSTLRLRHQGPFLSDVQGVARHHAPRVPTSRPLASLLKNKQDVTSLPGSAVYL